MSIDNRTSTQRLAAIANSIRQVEGRTNTYGIYAYQFDKEIQKLDPKLTQYFDDFENGYYGNYAVKCAASYMVANTTGIDNFVYGNTATPFYDKTLPSTPLVRNGEKGQIDCSTFIGLCLRGIPYEKSPYAKHKEADARWNPSIELSDMYGNNGWEFLELDRQAEGVFGNIGINGYSTIRYAADFGRYFYKYGRVLYDRLIDGTITDENKFSEFNLQPGDLIFWDTSDGNSDKRFRSISHIGMIAENTKNYYQVAPTSEVFHYTALTYQGNHPKEGITLIIRPDYRPSKPKGEVPLGVNLLGYPWTDRTAQFTKEGITITLLDEHSLNISGTALANVSFDIKNTNNTVKLSPGTYQLSGIEGFTGSSFTLQVRDSSGQDMSPSIRFPVFSTHQDTFTLDQEKEVTIKLYIARGTVLTDVIITPTLIRLS